MKRGFTLIELLLVILIISTLAVTVLVALDPLGRVQDTRNARRQLDIEHILTAVHEYIIDNGANPTGLSATEQQMGTSGTGCAIATGGCAVTAAVCLNLATPLIRYLKTIPFDPQTGAATTTRYSIVQDANGIVTVRACAAEGGAILSVSR